MCQGDLYWEGETRVTQNVGKVQISRRKHLPAPFWAISGNAFHGPENAKKYDLFAVFFGGSMAAIQPVWSNGCNISAAIRMKAHLHLRLLIPRQALAFKVYRVKCACCFSTSWEETESPRRPSSHLRQLCNTFIEFLVHSILQ